MMSLTLSRRKTKKAVLSPCLSSFVKSTRCFLNLPSSLIIIEYIGRVKSEATSSPRLLNKRRKDSLS